MEDDTDKTGIVMSKQYQEWRVEWHKHWLPRDMMPLSVRADFSCLLNFKELQGIQIATIFFFQMRKKG